MQKLNLATSIISSPIITCEFGGHTFGVTGKFNTYTGTPEIDYVTSLVVDKKASGTVNTYTLSMNYVVKPGQDPNYIDYIISLATDRKIKFTYGDSSQPQYLIKTEEAIITNVVPNVSISASSIQYTISATSSVALSYSVLRQFPEVNNVKPSDQILELLYGNSGYGLLQLFTGMQDKDVVSQNGWIDQTDKEVETIPQQVNISPLDRLRDLVSRMTSNNGGFFSMVIYDTPTDADGPYFRIINSNVYEGSGSTYEMSVDVGYPSSTIVFSFSASQSTSLALITSYQSGLDTNRAIDINDDNTLKTTSIPSMLISGGTIDSAAQSWWNNMVSYPISATLSIRGLLRPAILCEYINIRVLFFGREYTYSGRYMVTAQKDTIDSRGYKTDLSLVRVGDVEE